MHRITYSSINGLIYTHRWSERNYRLDPQWRERDIILLQKKQHNKL